jgi:uncharacterized Zn finger protein
MSIVTARDGGLFPKPKEIKMKCSCPDYAHLCKHLAAVLYGIGARLDQQPELLFLLRRVDHLELITAAGEQAAATKMGAKKPAIADDALSAIFGIELESLGADPPEASDPPAGKSKNRPERTRKAPVARPKKTSVRSGVAKKSKPPAPTKSAKRRKTSPIGAGAITSAGPHSARRPRRSGPSSRRPGGK